jgi:hypothetical protein
MMAPLIARAIKVMFIFFKSHVSVALLAVSLFHTPAVAAQPETVTLSTKTYPQFIAGELSGCLLTFEVVREDPQFSKGELVYLTGNLGFHVYDGKPGFKLKLVTRGLGANSNFVAPAEAFLNNGYGTNKADIISNFLGESGSRLFLFSAGDATMGAVFNGVKENKFTFSYAMVTGGLNAVVPVDLQIEKLDIEAPEKSVVSSKSVDEWVSCLRSTLDAERSRLENKK